jgi:hypothetical protein
VSSAVQLTDECGKGRVIQNLTFDSDPAEWLQQCLSSISKRRSEIFGDEAWLVACAVEAKEPGTEQLAAGLDRTQDHENLTLVDGRVLQMGIDEAAGKGSQVGAMIRKGRSIRFGRVLGRDSSDAEIELQRPTLGME